MSKFDKITVAYIRCIITLLNKVIVYVSSVTYQEV